MLQSLAKPKRTCICMSEYPCLVATCKNKTAWHRHFCRGSLYVMNFPNYCK